MQTSAHAKKEAFDTFLSNIRDALPSSASPDIKEMVHYFYGKLPLIDLETLTPETAAGIVMSGYEFMQQRTVGSPKIRILSHESSGVIEILNDDMPFLVDSITAEIVRHGIVITRVLHPIVHIKRNEQGQYIASGTPSNESKAESFIRIETARVSLPAENLEADILMVLQNVRYAVSDWAHMRTRIADSIADLKKPTTTFRKEEIQEVCDFLAWIEDRNFVFLGYVEYDFYDDLGHKTLSTVAGSELGVFRSEDNALKPKGLEALPPEVLHFALVPQPIEVTKSMRKSIVHRQVHMDYIGLKRFDTAGKVIGERRFLGLFTSNVYYQSAREIPFIRRKIERVLNRAAFDSNSYDGKTLNTIIEFTPRDELFQFNEEELFDYAMGILSMETNPGVRLFTRRDIFERFISCIVFLPRERFSSDLREQIQDILVHAFNGKVSAFYTQMTDSPLVRLQVIVSTRPGHIPAFDVIAMQAAIAKVASRWSDALLEALIESEGTEKADATTLMYKNAFPKTYIHNHSAVDAVYDIRKIEEVTTTGNTALEFFRNPEDATNIVHLKWYNPEIQVPLSDILPLLENTGFKVIDEQPYRITPTNSSCDTIWIRDFILQSDNITGITNEGTQKPVLFSHLEESLIRIWQHEAENDALAALVLTAGFTWREVALIRGYAKYLWQTTFPYSVDSIAATLNANPNIAKPLITLFHTRFDPSHLAHSTDALVTEIETKCSEVKSLSDDRILRRILAVILATLRTNYYQKSKDGSFKPYISLKFDSAKVPELPLPRPYAEIFVYSARMEGIHLRGGKVARGGLRWSDRKEDFRTEILGLVKAQMVKNSVIVPVGSKGGFILKQAPVEREAYLQEGIACYKIFLSGLLDLTDNIVDGKIISPQDVIRIDGDDPYLVVAADKGTATFSDYANNVSAQYGFWLGDAFASGGSVGYDHKKMAITAKGGFISVARHFQEIGVDIYNQDFSVIGIGDMAGDVFGNGMLLSKHIRLLGAFNHLHIFLDPNPDASTSYQERERMFNLPRSSWKDYNPDLISKGGGIFERSSKSIPLSLEVKAMLGTDKDAMSPDELMKTMLLAEVDLLWNGGIGTYIKAEDETNDQVGDRANNALRVNGKQLRCKVVGEGGNLGSTQKGRIEYALNGGRINTDAIDNSAGVDCSDHEVNIKIGVGRAVASGKLTLEKRDTLLASMTDEVAALVLRDNQLQTQVITMEQMFAKDTLEQHTRLMHAFERLGELNRSVEFLPSDKQISERKNTGMALTRPELAVLLSYSKMVLYPEILKSQLPDEPYFIRYLNAYFPTALQENFADEIAHHQLKREIIATVITNHIVNRMGITFIHAMAEDTGNTLADVARAFIAVTELFGIDTLWQTVEALDGKVPVAIQADMLGDIAFFVRRMTLWFLRNTPQPLDIDVIVQNYKEGITHYTECATAIVSRSIAENSKSRTDTLIEGGITPSLAAEIANLFVMFSAPDVVQVANITGKPIAEAGKLYFELGALLSLGWLRNQAGKIATASHWEKLAVVSVISNLFDEQRRLSIAVLQHSSLESWLEGHKASITRFHNFTNDLKTSEVFNLPQLVIAEKKIKEVG